MRLRNVKDANNILINSGLLVEANPFNDKKKLCIEIGTGKGVTEEDIINKTERYSSLVTSLSS